MKQFPKKDGQYDKSVEAEMLFSRTLLPDMFKSNDNLRRGHYEKYPALSTIC
jgi:hypothetical protein